MAELQQCSSCGGGNCDPDTHEFTEVQYTPPAEPNNLTAALASLLDLNGGAPAFSATGTNFLTGGDTRDFDQLPDTAETRRSILLAAAAQYSDTGSNVTTAATPGFNTTLTTAAGTATTTTTTTQSQPTNTTAPSSLEQVFGKFIDYQRSRDERQEARDQQMMELLQQQAAPRPPPPAEPPTPTAGKVVVTTLRNPENAAYVGMTLPTMYTVEGDPKNLQLAKKSLY